MSIPRCMIQWCAIVLPNPVYVCLRLHKYAGNVQVALACHQSQRCVEGTLSGHLLRVGALGAQEMHHVCRSIFACSHQRAHVVSGSCFNVHARSAECPGYFHMALLCSHQDGCQAFRPTKPGISTCTESFCCCLRIACSRSLQQFLAHVCIVRDRQEHPQAWLWQASNCLIITKLTLCQFTQQLLPCNWDGQYSCQLPLGIMNSCMLFEAQLGQG
mmetsp:Transcript_118630/g.215748  ORF Transcript_118630/g.215748 Transcript_118630/m.215748 type:complete len:215 (-) Transcript_118630:367-1011(-)